MKRLIIFLSALCISLSMLPLPAVFAEDRGVQVNPVEIKEKSELIEVDIRYPQIKGAPKKTIERKLNKKFKTDSLNFKKEIESQAAKGYEQAKNEGFPFHSYQAFQDFKASFNKNNILSIPITFYSYTGGAHGGSFIAPNNIDLLTGNFLTLKDVFKDGVDYKKIIIEEITKSIKENPEDYFPEALETVNKLSDNQAFYLVEDGIVVYYGEYDIAPYASGIREFKIPFTRFKGGVRERFL